MPIFEDAARIPEDGDRSYEISNRDEDDEMIIVQSVSCEASQLQARWWKGAASEKVFYRFSLS